MEQQQQGTKLDHRVLAEGEVTGHAHRASAGELYDVGGGVLTLETDAPATITHEEHGAFTIPAGSFERTIVREFDHAAEAVRNVVD